MHFACNVCSFLLQLPNLQWSPLLRPSPRLRPKRAPLALSGLSGFLWASLAFSGLPWLSLGFLGIPCASLSFSGYPWASPTEGPVAPPSSEGPSILALLLQHRTTSMPFRASPFVAVLIKSRILYKKNELSKLKIKFMLKVLLMLLLLFG